MSKKVSRWIKIVIIFLAVAEVYVGEASFHFGGFGFPQKYLLALTIIGITFVTFLIDPDFEKGRTVFGYAFVFSTPYIVSILYSMLIWVLRFAGLRYMTRGLFYPSYVIIATFTAAALVYIFEKQAAWVMMGVVTVLCLYRMAIGIMESGWSEWISQWLVLMQTWGIEVGSALSYYEEYNETLFGLGIFLMYGIIMLWEYREYRRKLSMWVFLLLSCFCFITGFKRIALAAIPIGLLVVLLSRPMKDPGRKKYAVFAGVCILLFSIFYLFLVSTNLFTEAAAAFGIDTKGRDVLYETAKEWYTISPVFFGQGLGFVSRRMYELKEAVVASLGAQGYAAGEIHNDILRNYIEVGFYGFPIWLYLMTVFRIRYFAKRSGGRAAVVTAVCILYMFVTYLTDNTYYYNMPNLAAALVAMTYAYQEEGKWGH